MATNLSPEIHDLITAAVDAAEARFSEKLSETEARIDARFAESEARFEDRFAKSEAHVDERMETRIGVLFEQQAEVLKVINERLHGMTADMATKSDIARLDSRLDTIERVVTATNAELRDHAGQLTNHETRLGTLGRAA